MPLRTHGNPEASGSALPRPVPRLMGMPIHAVTLDEAVDRVFDGLAEGRGGTVLTPNIDILRQYRRSAELRRMFEHSELVVTDGMPLVVALRIQRTPVPGQITGTDMLRALAAGAAARGRSIMLAGGRPGEAERAAERLRQVSPGLRAQTRPCYVRPDTVEAELASLARALVAAAPDIVFVGLPFASQTAVMNGLRSALPGTWFVGVGSSFDFVNGDRSRPPALVRRLCLEWAWRLTSQPWLWRRYLVDGMPTTARLAVDALRTRWRHDASTTSAGSPALP
ncbi:WecB/TagA/CpsF family glycosyltransferase [Streptomyces roseicoloratus]|uniref:WecB/TagA/CpsF family glycosyltransferase n=1 Tax=Streptomyces roseicoloratus TaxID=2508722 RepID=A0ABY9S2U7_9ACTN|nr:WecB/TagA/CpsF family glycosyltransferase [Streptomyces roseicoloratus]WMX48349.1 WecB/TagA/CpsF family glycosyltransferase [Streptomyces roseicoloratus]